ncbi:hypothetical protein [Mycolicibacterium moriokaense]|uniref:Uncharacterized protein n=1 Tax=Mycolicibacterium moriokaense TaxID=39691 RepID=A0A318HCW9_9MYCO|nr:hypothetical protein [Mycolicibacterium moriokaense]PXX06373.1 hypothetical protein C8E89_114146 [Mycolicibacterium moriokaense]
MAHLLFVRPADDSAAGQIATLGQAIRLLATAFTTTDLYGLQANRVNVDVELPNATSLFYFGHGSPAELVANGAALVDQQNVGSLGGGIVVAIACYAAIILGPQAVQTPSVEAFLGFDDEFGFPLLAPAPMAMGVIDGLRGLLTQGDDIGSAADELRQGFARAKVDYKTNGSNYGLSRSDARTAWLYAKSNQHSVCLYGDTSAKL